MLNTGFLLPLKEKRNNYNVIHTSSHSTKVAENDNIVFHARSYLIKETEQIAVVPAYPRS